jgi:hypothetical protein
MGYTHYWNVIEPAVIEEKFAQFVEGATQIIHTALEAGITVTDIEVSENKVVFEGQVETFYFEKVGESFNFCKTGQEPYDTVVTAVLIHAKKVFGKALKVSSDGNWAEWSDGRLLYETVYDVQPTVGEVFGNVVD